MKKTQKIIGYIRVSSLDQDTEKNEAQILKFANDKNFGKVEFVSEKISGTKSWKNRKLADVVEKLKEKDILIVPELSRLGRSLPDILNILQTLTDKNVLVFSVKENFQINGDDIQSKIMRTMLGLFSEIERDLLSMRTKEGLVNAREKGRMGGRPKGSGSSKLDPHKDDIIKQLEAGVKKKYIAKVHSITAGTLTAWLIKHKLTKIKPKL